MANALANLFTDIADSIRSKTGSTEKMSPSDFPSQIDSISVGGGGAEGCATVTFMNGDNVLLTRPVYIGDDCPDPVTQGRIETPTKESTVQYNYTYKGWASYNGGTANSSVLKNITEDKVVYSAYAQSTRYYTVTFYDGTTVLHTEQVAYGGSSTYTYEKENAIFSGWTPEPTNIASNLDCYGAWEEGLSFASASWERIAEISESGKASEVFAIGDERTEKIGSYNITFVIADFNYDLLGDDSGNTAGMTIIMKDSNTFGYSFSDVKFTGADWLSTPFYTTMQSIYNSKFPEELKAVIKPVKKKYYQNSTTDLLESTENIWIPSIGEVVSNNNYFTHSAAERSQDRYYALFNDYNYIICPSAHWSVRTKNPSDSSLLYYVKSGKSSVTYAAISTYFGYFRLGFCI